MMERSYLVQRLKRPRGGGPLGTDNPFSFGGGLRNGGLSDEAMGLIRGLWSFDYMGAAEFEFGAVPEALQKLAVAASNDELSAFAFPVTLAKVAPNWRAKDEPEPDGIASVYVLCRRDDAEEVQRRIEDWAGAEWDTRLKEPTQLSSALRPYNDWDAETAGWLELDNGFAFFTDETMWRGVCELFGVEVPA